MTRDIRKPKACMNQVWVTGAVMKDPVYKEVAGRRMCELHIVTSAKTFFPTTKGNCRVNGKFETTEFIPIAFWSKHCDFAMEYLKKNTIIGIRGSLHNDHYKTDDGKDLWHCHIIAEDIQMFHHPEFRYEKEKDDEDDNDPT